MQASKILSCQMRRMSERQWGRSNSLNSLPAGLHCLQAGEEEAKEGGKKRDDWRESEVSQEAGKVPGVGHGEQLL